MHSILPSILQELHELQKGIYGAPLSGLVAVSAAVALEENWIDGPPTFVSSAGLGRSLVQPSGVH